MLASASTQVGPVPFFKSNDDGTAITLWVPGLLIKAASRVVENEDFKAAELMRKLGTTSIRVVDGKYFKEDLYRQKMDHLQNRFNGKNYKDLVQVHSAESQVMIKYKKNHKGKIRKVVIAVLDDDTFVFLKSRCNISLKELKALSKSTF